MLQSFLHEVHFHIDVPLAVSKCSRNLQAFSLYCRQPDSLRIPISTRCHDCCHREFKVVIQTTSDHRRSRWRSKGCRHWWWGEGLSHQTMQPSPQDVHLFELHFCLDVSPGEGLLDHMATLFLFFWGTSILFSIVAAPISIPTNSVETFPFLHTLSSIYL